MVIDCVVSFTTEVFTLEEGIDLILSMNWLRANTISLTWEVKDELMFRPGVGVAVNTEESVTQAPRDGAKPEKVVAQHGENLEIDIQVVSSLSEWDEAVAEGYAVGCLWFIGDDESVATLWTDSQGNPVVERLPLLYREFAEVFSREGQNRLPEHGPWDMSIDLEPGKQPPSGRLYPLSHDEMEYLRAYIDEMLKSGKIRPSKSPCGAPIFIVPKPHGRGLRVVVDYRGLNAITIKD